MKRACFTNPNWSTLILSSSTVRSGQEEITDMANGNNIDDLLI